MADALESETSHDELNGSAGFDQSQLEASLKEWDDRFEKSFDPPPEAEPIEPRDPEEIAEFERRIEALESEKSEAIERADQNELLADFVESSLARVDQHDFDRAVERISDEAGVNPRVALLELRDRILTDEDFRDACDGRHDDPDLLSGMVEDLIEDVMEKYPQSSDDFGLRAAVLAARSAPSGGGYDADSNLKLGQLSNEQFGEAKRKIFADLRSGKLRPSGGRGGFFSTAP